MKKSKKPINAVAKNLLDRNGPYKYRTVQKKTKEKEVIDDFLENYGDFLDQLTDEENDESRNRKN
jgi:hypothetical protein